MSERGGEPPGSDTLWFGPSRAGQPGDTSFGKRVHRPQREVSIRGLRLKMLLNELLNVVGQDTEAGVQPLLTFEEDPEPRIAMGADAYLEIDAESGCFVFHDRQGTERCVSRTASEDRAVDLVVGYLSCVGPEALPASGRGALQSLLGRSIADVERQLIVHTLRQVNGNRRVAAAILDISLQDLRAKLRSYWLRPQASLSNPDRPPAGVVAPMRMRSDPDAR